MSDTPNLRHAFERAMDSRFNDFWTSTIGRVESYDDDTKSMSVQLLVRREYYDERNERQTELLPVLTDVPVMGCGSGGVRVKFPITAGDFVLVMFASQSLDKWLVSGGRAVDPEDPRRNVISDAVALTGLEPFSTAHDKTPIIEFTTGGQIHVGGSSALALKSDVDTIRNAAVTAVGFSQFQTAMIGSSVGTSIVKGA